MVGRRLSPMCALAALGAAVSAGAPAAAESPVQPLAEMSDHAELGRAVHESGEPEGDTDPEESGEGEGRHRSLLVVPIPQSSPSLGTGIFLVGALFYNPNRSREPWISGVGVMRTSNGSQALGLLHKMTLAGDRFRVTAFAGRGDVNVNFYGTGPGAGARDVSIELNERGWARWLSNSSRGISASGNSGSSRLMPVLRSR